MLKNAAYHPRARALACSTANRTSVDWLKRTATMALRSWSRDGMKHASCQASCTVLVDMHGQPEGGSFVKRTPCRQQGLRLKRHAARLPAKPVASNLELSLSNINFWRRFVWRARARNCAAARNVVASLPDKMSSRSLVVFKFVPCGSWVVSQLKSIKFT